MGKLSICQCRYIHTMQLYVSVYSAIQMLYHAIQLVQDAMGVISSLCRMLLEHYPACAGCYGSAIQLVQDAMGVLSSLYAVLAAYAGAI